MIGPVRQGSTVRRRAPPPPRADDENDPSQTVRPASRSESFLQAMLGQGRWENVVISAECGLPSDFDCVDNEGWTVLHRALAMSAPMEVLQCLVACGGRQAVNARTDAGRTPLMVSVQYNCHPNVVSLLLDRDADVNAQDQDGNTALHHLVLASSSPELSLLLMTTPACDQALANAKGLTAVGLAKVLHREHVLEARQGKRATFLA